MNLGVHLKGSKRVLKGQSHIFAYKNMLFGIFALGAVPRSSALCLLFFWLYNQPVDI